MIISKSLSENIEKIKKILIDCDDVIYRDIFTGDSNGINMELIYIDGMTDKKLISDYAMESLIHDYNPVILENLSEKELFRKINSTSIAVTEIKTLKTIEEVVDFVLIGETVLLVDNCSKGVMLSSRGWPTRSVSQPISEAVIRGPRDGFVETLKMNTSLIRRRIRDPKLKLKYLQLGRRSKTDIAIMYIKDIVNDDILEKVFERLNRIDIDAILESSYIEGLIEDDRKSPFPQIENTERPDAAAAALYEGRVVIGVDNTTCVLIVPAVLNIFMQSSEDYYERWFVSSIIRIIRYIALPITILLPALYVAITSFHPGMLPSDLTLYVAATRSRVPFPAYFEAALMETVMELIREGGSRIVGPLGSTIGIVGGLVIGQAAVEAGLISPIVVIIVALTAITSFVIPDYSFSNCIRMLRFIFIALAATFGLLGITIGVCILLTHLSNLKSFGIPYLTPYSNFAEEKTDLKDSFIKRNITKMIFRPKYINTKNRIRQNIPKSKDNKD